jgi:hypothetical protein
VSITSNDANDPFSITQLTHWSAKSSAMSFASDSGSSAGSVSTSGSRLSGTLGTVGSPGDTPQSVGGQHSGGTPGLHVSVPLSSDPGRQFGIG